MIFHVIVLMLVAFSSFIATVNLSSRKSWIVGSGAAGIILHGCTINEIKFRFVRSHSDTNNEPPQWRRTIENDRVEKCLDGKELKLICTDIVKHYKVVETVDETTTKVNEKATEWEVKKWVSWVNIERKY